MVMSVSQEEKQALKRVDGDRKEMEEEKEYGYTIFWVILNRLFPERFNDKGSINPNSEIFTRCFEDGGLVFNDVEHGLFNILLGANNNSELVSNGDPVCRMNETTGKGWKDSTGTFGKLKKKSHFLLDQISNERSGKIDGEYVIFQLVHNQKDYEYNKMGRKGVGTSEIEIKFRNCGVWGKKQWCRGIGKPLGIYERYIG